MSEELLDRLRRLGVTRGTRALKPAAPRAWSNRYLEEASLALEQQFPGGHVEENALGAYFVVDAVYPQEHRHGPSALSSLLTLSPELAAPYCGDERLATLDFRDFVFLDTETTGLHGAGTVAFLVGIAFFDRQAESEAFIVRQFFLRDHGDEAAMLHALDELLATRAGLVTFNGRTFDLPLLSNRYLMNQLPGDPRSLPHIDLLPLSRRLWRRRVGSVALSNLETAVLGIRRTGADVPGWLIPTIYTDYLRSHDTRELGRVFYHNEVDLLSMVTLADYQIRLINRSLPSCNPIDVYSLGKWQADIGMATAAEATLSDVVRQDLPLSLYHEALARLALLFKRQGRYEEAAPLWQQWAATTFDSVDAHVELAKYFEWQAGDLEAAVRWTRRALDLVDGWPQMQAQLQRPELLHRLDRLQRKLVE